MILVTGSTGTIGAMLISSLARSGVLVKALSRSVKSDREIEHVGAIAIRGNFDNAASMEEALHGCDRLFLLSPPATNQAERERASVEAAMSVGVQRVIKLSAADADLESSVPWARQHAEVEDYLTSSGVDWTILRPTALMQNLLGASQEITEGRLAGTGGQGKAAYVDARDVAAAASQVLTEDGHEGRTYILTGPEDLAGDDIAIRLSESLEKEVTYIQITEQELRSKLEQVGMDQWMIEGLIEQYKLVAFGEATGVTDDLTRILGRPPRSLSDFAKDYREAFSEAARAS